MIETQVDAKTRVLQSDHGRGHIDENFQEYLIKKGIVSQLTCVNTPQQDGIAERKKSLLIRSGSIIDI